MKDGCYIVNNCFINKIVCGDSALLLKALPDNYVDLIISSPPYDELRSYKGFVYDFVVIAKEMTRILKPGGCIIWIRADSTKGGTESGTSFKEALYFKDYCGLLLYDTMIYAKNFIKPLTHRRYEQEFEYMFILSKGPPKTFNPIKRETKHKGKPYSANIRHDLEHLESAHGKGKPIKDECIIGNIWYYDFGGWGSPDGSANFAHSHTAVMPEKLVYDHIYSWSNPGDLVLDPFIGSGTTAAVAARMGRNFIGIDISEEYVKISQARVDKEINSLNLFSKI